MRRRWFGSTGREVAAIGFGTWYLEHAPRAAAVLAIRRALDRGSSHIDTAELYGSGAAEEVIGEAIAGRRDEVFLVSKVMPQNASRAGVLQACERSLARLRTDRLDCYLLHWRGPHPLIETIEGFEELRHKGKIISWGVSNFDVRDLEEALGLAGEGEIACNQVLYHLLERRIEHRVLPWCQENGVAVVGYSPFGHNRFPEPRSQGGRVLTQIAETHKATPRQVALAFLTRRAPLFTIPKASSAAHAIENADAGELLLSAEEVARIDSAFPAGSRGRELPMS
jgi:diketogulonate reductase-like aldo/keto reductase